jgi:hypothetical protein
MANRREDDDSSQRCNGDAPCFSFGWEGEETVDDYIWRVANILGDDASFHMRRFHELQRSVREGSSRSDDHHPMYNQPWRNRHQPGQYGDGWQEFGHWMRSEPTDQESVYSEEELMEESIGHLCMVAICLLLFYV